MKLNILSHFECSCLNGQTNVSSIISPGTFRDPSPVVMPCWSIVSKASPKPNDAMRQVPFFSISSNILAAAPAVPSGLLALSSVRFGDHCHFCCAVFRQDLF